jgi:cytochrome c oxidase assembly protein Cox11
MNRLKLVLVVSLLLVAMVAVVAVAYAAVPVEDLVVQQTFIVG